MDERIIQHVTTELWNCKKNKTLVQQQWFAQDSIFENLANSDLILDLPILHQEQN